MTSVSQASGSKPNRVPKRKSGVTPSMTRNKIGGVPLVCVFLSYRQVVEVAEPM